MNASATSTYRGTPEGIPSVSHHLRSEEPRAMTKSASVKSSTVFDNNTEKLRCVLELIHYKGKATDENTDIASGSTGVRATTYFLLPSTVPGEGERAIQRGEPFVFTLPHDDDLYVADFLASFTLQKQQAGYHLHSTNAFFDMPKTSESSRNAEQSVRDVPSDVKPSSSPQEGQLGPHFLGEEAKKDIDILCIARYFRLPISTAARRLQVGETWLKQKCRQHDINRWPYRKLRSIEKCMAKFQLNLQEEAKAQGAANVHRIQSLQSQIAELQLAIKKISMGQVLIHDSDEDDACHNEASSPDTCDRPTKPPGCVEAHDRNFKRVLTFDDSSKPIKAIKAEAVATLCAQSPPVAKPEDVVDMNKPFLKPIIPKLPTGADLEWETLFRNILTPYAREDSGSPFKWSTPRSTDCANRHCQNPPSAQSTASSFEIVMASTPGRSPFARGQHKVSSDSKMFLTSPRLLDRASSVMASPRHSYMMASPRHSYMIGSSPQILSSKLRSSVLSPLKSMHRVPSNSMLDDSTDSDVLSLLLCDEALDFRRMDEPGSPIPAHMEALLPDLCKW